MILLLKGVQSLKQLYTLSMDIHSRYRTEAHNDVVPRFNERFILSLGSCESCLVIDDELNVLPVSGGRGVKPLPAPNPGEDTKTPSQKELGEVKESLRSTQPIGSLIQLARTHDQAKALLTFVDAIAEKTLRSTVTLTAARGRGKSAASTYCPTSIEDGPCRRNGQRLSFVPLAHGLILMLFNSGPGRCSRRSLWLQQCTLLSWTLPPQ